MGITCALVGLAATIGSTIATIDAIETTRLIVTTLLLIPLVFFIVMIVGVVSIFQPSPFCVIAFNESLVYAKGTHMTLLRWPEIAYCERIKTRKRGITYCTYLIRTHTGQLITWKVHDRVMPELDRICAEKRVSQ